MSSNKKNSKNNGCNGFSVEIELSFIKKYIENPYIFRMCSFFYEKHDPKQSNMETKLHETFIKSIKLTVLTVFFN